MQEGLITTIPAHLNARKIHSAQPDWVAVGQIAGKRTRVALWDSRSQLSGFFSPGSKVNKWKVTFLPFRKSYDGDPDFRLQDAPLRIGTDKVWIYGKWQSRPREGLILALEFRYLPLQEAYDEKEF